MSSSVSMAPPRLRSPILEHDSIAHGFFGRAGGVSKGLYASLNTGLGTNDDPGDVRENRARCARSLGVGAERLLTLHQTHSSAVVIVREPFDMSRRPEADAMATDRPGMALGVLAADCMPVLFADIEARVIGAAHAGWRGALAGVLEATVDAMQSLGADPSRIAAALGPCLRRPNFEVGLDLVEAFTGKYGEAARFFASGRTADKRQFDLAGFARERLAAKGVTAFDDLDACTLGDPASWFSYRASRHRREDDYGRNLSAIALTP
jgi:hypothetical protein